MSNLSNEVKEALRSVFEEENKSSFASVELSNRMSAFLAESYAAH